MTPHDRLVAETLKSRLSAAAPGHLRKLIVFGSRAREEPGGDADLDVAALVDARTPDLEQRLDDAAYDVMWAFDFSPVISLKVFEESRFEQALDQGLPFYRHVQREGICL